MEAQKYIRLQHKTTCKIFASGEGRRQNCLMNNIGVHHAILVEFKLSKLTYHNIGTWGPLFTKRYDVLPQDLVKSRSREIRI